MKTTITKLLIPVIVGSFCVAGAWTVEAQSAPPEGAPAQGQVPGMMSGDHSGMMGRRNMSGPRLLNHAGMNHPGMGRNGWNADGWGHRGGMWQRGMGHRGMNWGVGPRGRLMALVCSNRGTERLEIAFVRLSYRLNLTDHQRTLFDDLKNTAIAEQQKFAETCQSALPRRQAGQRPDPVETFRDHITVETAKLAAMNAVLPKFEALYQSLDDGQKRLHLPRGMRGGRPGANQNRPGAQAPSPQAQPNGPGGNGGNIAPAPGNDGGGQGGGTNMAPGGGQGGGESSQGGSNPPPASYSI
jgi:hypothetical protein